RLSAGFQQQAITRLPRRCLNAACGLLAPPAEDAMRHPEHLRERSRIARLGGSLLAKSVIDGEGVKRDALAAPCPARGKDQQRQRVRAARKGDRNILRRREGRNPGRKFGCADRRDRSRQSIILRSHLSPSQLPTLMRKQQHAFSRSRCARATTAGEACGNFDPRSPQTVQAASLLPSAARLIPSFSRLSGALLLDA